LLADLSTLADRGEWDIKNEWTPDSEVKNEVPKSPEYVLNSLSHIVRLK
jgi:hypothetical protein